MSPSARNLLILVASFAVSAQAGTDDTRPDDYVARARQFLQALYPGMDHIVDITINTRDRLGDMDGVGMFSMELSELFTMPPGGVPGVRPGEAPPPLPVEPNLCGNGCECKNPVLSAEFGFANGKADYALFMAWMGGPFVSCRLDKFLKEVKRHPQWALARILAELNTDGAKFGPDHEAEFLRALHIEKLKPFVGELQVTSTEFQVPELTWLVRTKWHSRDGQMEADGFLVFEPFEGRLMGYRRRLAPDQTPEKKKRAQSPMLRDSTKQSSTADDLKSKASIEATSHPSP